MQYLLNGVSSVLAVKLRFYIVSRNKTCDDRCSRVCNLCTQHSCVEVAHVNNTVRKLTLIIDCNQNHDNNRKHKQNLVFKAVTLMPFGFVCRTGSTPGRSTRQLVSRSSRCLSMRRWTCVSRETSRVFISEPEPERSKVKTQRPRQGVPQSRCSNTRRFERKSRNC